MEDISGFSLRVQLVASTTFPAGITLSQFADDADPFDLPSQQIGDKAMGLNGDLLFWSKANPLLVTLNMIPAGDDAKNLKILLEANRVGRGKFSAKDVITITAVYPDGGTLTLSNGKLTDGFFGRAVSSAGRIKTGAFAFVFEGVARTGAN